MKFNEWNKVKLGEVIQFNPPETLKKGTIAKKVGMDKLAPYQKKINGYEYQEYKGGVKFRNGDTLFARITPSLENGKTAQVDILDKEEIGFGSTEFIVWREKEGKTINDFIYYLSISPEIRDVAIKSMTGTSGRQRVQLDALKNQTVILPPVEEQKAIADFLSSLDKKIEVNNQISAILEKISNTIFRHWFIDFEFPNENGEPYKSSGGEMVESDMGLIPKGWKIGTVEDLGTVVGGGTPSKNREDYYTENGIPWITPKDLSNNKNRYISRGTIDITEEGFNNSSVRLLPRGTVLFSSRAPIGYIAIAKNEVTTNQGFKSIIPNENIGTEYVYQFLKYNIDLIESRASGSTFKEISGRELKKVPAIIPGKSVLEKFNLITNSLGNLIEKCEEETQVLINIRDTLLPKLISGEIRVPVENE